MKAAYRSIEPPKAAVRPKKIVTHGDVRVDEYAWLQDKSDPAVLAHVRAENEYADEFMRPASGLQRGLYKEIRKRMKEDDMSVPIEDGPYLYYSRMKKGKQYAIHCRKLAAGGKEETILDENALAKGKKYFNLGVLEVSPDHSLLAYAVDVDGSERYELRIKELATGREFSERIPSVSDIEWAEDNAHLFYTVEEHPHPPRKVFLHELGESPERDALIYEEADEQWYVALDKSRSRRFIYLTAANFDSTEVRFIPADQPRGRWTLVAPRKKEVKYQIEHHGEYFYIVTNEKAVNYKVMRTPVSDIAKRNWKEWLPHNIDRAITDLQIYEKFFALSVREKGSEEVYIHAPGAARGKKIPLPEQAHMLSVWSDLEYVSKYVRISYQSFLTPNTVWDIDALSLKKTLRKRQSAPWWKGDRYVSKREWVVNGGVKVPVTLVYKKGAKLDGSNPLLLDAYGAYGITHDPHFSISRPSLIDRGWIVAYGHPRGGGEMGWHWHKQAKVLTKHRTYQDVVAIARHLIKKKYTSPERLALTGGSAGGMMVGAVLNLAPQLFAAAIAYVPAVDALTTSLDESLGGTRLHYDETGDPRKQKHYFYLKKWSPYESVRAAAYPALLVRANLNDIRTPFWEAAKWVARLRARKTDKNPLLLKTETVAGHFGRSGRYSWIQDRAFDYAFLLKMIPNGSR